MAYKKKKKVVQRHFKDYVELTAKLFGTLKKDLFTGDLHRYDEIKDMWVPVLGSHSMGRLRSKIRDLDEGWSHSAIEDHILSYTDRLKGQLLVDIPDWDGEPRLHEVAKCIDCSNFTHSEVEEILKDWGVKMFQRLADPMVQNRILILKSEEGLGKDTLIEHMLSHLGQYLVPFTIQSQEKDTYELISSGLVMNISEYDRTNKHEVAVLKNIITGKRMKFRGAYERKAEFRVNRASYIASCNVADILRESGKNRRYIILDVEAIHWRYPIGQSDQILAEWKYLASKSFEISEETNQKITEYVATQTPVDPETEIAEYFQYLLSKKVEVDVIIIDDETFAPANECVDILKEVSKTHQYSVRGVQSILKRKRISQHTRKGTYYRIPQCEDQENLDF